MDLKRHKIFREIMYVFHFILLEKISKGQILFTNDYEGPAEWKQIGIREVQGEFGEEEISSECKFLR